MNINYGDNITQKLRKGMKIRIAFSGSGFLNPVHAGAICAILDNNIEIVEAVGTSGGALIASCISLNRKQDYYKALAMKDLPNGITNYEPSALFHQGYNSGNILKKFIHSEIGDVKISDLMIPIKIVATDVDNGIPYIFSQETTPDILLLDACRASCSIPFFYSPYYVNGIKFIDGGATNNFGIDLLTVDNIPRFGISIDVQNKKGDTSTLLSYATQFLNIIRHDGEYLTREHASKMGISMIKINIDDHTSPFDSNFTIEQKQELFEKGYYAVLSMLEK